MTHPPLQPRVWSLEFLAWACSMTEGLCESLVITNSSSNGASFVSVARLANVP